MLGNQVMLPLHTIMLAMGLVLILISGIGLFMYYRPRVKNQSTTYSDPSDALDSTIQKLDETEDYMRRIERLSRKEIDRKNDKKR